MTEEASKQPSGETPPGERTPLNKWIGIGIGAGIGSAALAAALLYANGTCKPPKNRSDA